MVNSSNIDSSTIDYCSSSIGAVCMNFKRCLGCGVRVPSYILIIDKCPNCHAKEVGVCSKCGKRMQVSLYSGGLYCANCLKEGGDGVN